MSLSSVVASAVTGASPLTPNLPTGIATGDIVTLYLAIDASTSPSTPAPTNWNLITTGVNGTAMKVAAWSRTWPAGGTAPSVSWTGGGKGRCWMVRELGADTTTPVKAGALGSSGSTASMPTVDVGTAGVRGSRLTTLYCNTTAATAITADDRCTIVNDGNTGTTTASTDGRGAVMTYERMAEGAPSALAAGNYTATGAAAAWCSLSFWIQPAVADQFGLLQSRAQIVAANATNALAFGSALTSGSLIVAKLSAFSGNTSTVAYGGGSTSLALAVRANNTTNERTEIWYKENNADTTAATVTATNAGANDNTMLIEEWLGAATSGGPVTTGTNSSASSSTANVTSSGNTPAGASLVLSAHDVDINGSVSALDANSQQRYAKQATANSALIAQSRELTSGGATVTTNYTASAAGGMAACNAVFNVLSGGGGATRAPMLTMMGVG